MQDLHITEWVSLHEALFGFSRSISHPSRKPVRDPWTINLQFLTLNSESWTLPPLPQVGAKLLTLIRAAVCGV